MGRIKESVGRISRKSSMLYYRDIYPHITHLRGATFIAKKMGDIALAASKNLEPSISINNIRLSDEIFSLNNGTQRNIITGGYESEEFEIIDEHLPQDEDVIELGGGIGYISTLINSKISEDNDQIVLEANSNLIEILQNHKEINKADFKILNKAYNPTKDSLEFLIKDSFLSSTAQYEDEEGETVEVDALSLRDLSERFSIESFSLVTDIEGAEYEMLEEEFDLISEKCEFVLIEFHNTEKEKNYNELIEKLKENGFKEVNKSDVGDHSVHAFTKM